MTTVRQWFAARWRGYVHGGGWKIAALACKFAFLIYVAPRMPEGEFARFLFWQSAALLITRAAAMGLMDELPVRVRGRLEEARRFWPLIRALQVVSLAALAVSWFIDSPFVAALALVPVLVTGAIFEGVIRTLSPAWFERALNWPWILFLLLLVVAGADSAVGTLHLYAAALFVSQLGVSMALRPDDVPAVEHRLVPDGMLQLVRHGSVKMLSDFTLLANLRAPVLLPVLLTGALQSDRVSFALAIADAVASLLMVIVNRNYVLYCRNEVPVRSVLVTIVVIVLVMALAGLGAMAVGTAAPALLPGGIRPADLLWTCLFFGAITAYQDARYYFWARGQGVTTSIAVQVAALVAQACIVALLPQQYWLPGIALAFIVAVLLVSGAVFRDDRVGAAS